MHILFSPLNYPFNNLLEDGLIDRHTKTNADMNENITYHLVTDLEPNAPLLLFFLL